MFNYLWCCHMTQVILRVHQVHLINVKQCQVAVGPQTKPTNLGCYCLHSRHHLLLLSLKAYRPTHMTVPQRVEGLVDLGTQRVRNLPKVFLRSRDQAGSQTPHLKC